MLKQNQRALNRAMRDLDRERTKMENQEKKVIADIKKYAKMGQMVSHKTQNYGKQKMQHRIGFLLPQWWAHKGSS